MEQPENSKIKITRTENTVKIYIPPARFFSSLAVILTTEFALNLPILLIACGAYAAKFPFKIVCAIFSLPFLIGAIAICSVLPNLLFASTQIYLNSQQITIDFNQKISGSIKEVIPREKITELRRIERHNVIENDNAVERSDIIFTAGDNEYRLRSYTYSDLLETELDWLADEISSFLDLPITYQSSPSA